MCKKLKLDQKKKPFNFIYRVYHLLKTPLHLLSFSALEKGSCRYSPTCSRFCRQAIRKHGALKGGWLCLKRVLRCNPLFPPGPDPVP